MSSSSLSVDGACGWPSRGLGWAVRLQVATTWEGVGAGHHVPYVDFA
jgi:hypothetical protein